MRSLPFRAALLLCFLATMSALAQEKPSERRFINLPRPTTAQGLPFSDAVVVGNTLYIAGRLGLDPNTGQPPADVEQDLYLLSFTAVRWLGAVTPLAQVRQLRKIFHTFLVESAWI